MTGVYLSEPFSKHRHPLDIIAFLTYKDGITFVRFFYYASLSAYMHPEYNPAEAGEILNRSFEPSAAVDGRVGSQLSQPTDVHAARDFFQSSGGQAKLPDLQLDGFGLDSNVGNATIQSSTGFESTLGTPATTVPGLDAGLMPGLEQGALAGVPAAGEPISPLVQMILKMPGLTGIVGDFFSALMAFFFPADGGLMNLLDPALWAGMAQQALTSVSTFVMHDLPLTMTTMGGSNNPFQTLLQNGLLDGSTKVASSASPVTLSLEHQPLGIQSYEVGGVTGPGSSLYEMSSMDGSQFFDGGAANIDVSSNKFIAMEGGNSFGPTVGGASVPTAPMPATQPQGLAQPAPTYQSAGTDGSSIQGVTPERGSLLQDNTTGSGTEIANSNANPAHHVVENGDNLWNIAKDNLGSGSRWTEIYDLNKDVVGSNPNLIFKGADLKLPGVENTASGADNYVVQSGDNLWNISKEHLGGGQNWHAIYEQNAQTIGSNPDLIHPGQNLAIPNGGSHMQVAHAGPTAPAHAATHHPAATAQHAPAHQGAAAHARTAHAPAHHPAKTVAHTSSDAVSPSKDVAQQTSMSAAAQASDAGVLKTEEFGNTAQSLDNLTQEIGLKATAKSL